MAKRTSTSKAAKANPASATVKPNTVPSVVLPKSYHRKAWHPEPEPELDDSWFCVIKDGMVIFKAKELLSANEFRDAHPGSIVCERSGLNPRRNYEIPNSAVDNPVAAVVYTLSDDTADNVFEIFHDLLEYCDIYDDRTSGTTWHVIDEDEESGEFRTATNSESAQWHFAIKIGAIIDLQRPVFPQVAAWCRDRAAEFARVAEACDMAEDGRDFGLIRKVIRNTDFVPSLVRECQTLNKQGKVVHDKLAESRNKRLATASQTSDTPSAIPMELFRGLRLNRFAVVDSSRIAHQSDNLAEAMAFREGRGGDAVIIGLPNSDDVAALREKRADAA